MRSDPFDRPLDAMLERLRVHGITYGRPGTEIDRWVTSCAVCGQPMMLHEPYLGSPVTVRCSAGCHESRVVRALAAEPHRYDEGLDLAEDASAAAWRALDLLEQACR